MRILLVEDDPDLGNTLQRAIEHEGYLVEWVVSAEQADAALHHSEFDLIVLDWQLPGQSGPEWLKAQRSQQKATPVLMLTARLGVDNKVAGLDAGADDYLTKPFDLAELNARLRALGRRRHIQHQSNLTARGLSLNPDSGELTTEEGSFILSRNELLVMRCLMENAGRFLSKSRLADATSHWDEPITSNAIEAQISRLRKRLGKHHIVTLRGVGYKVEPI